MAHRTTAGGGASRYALAPAAGPGVTEGEIERVRGGVRGGVEGGAAARLLYGEGTHVREIDRSTNRFGTVRAKGFEKLRAEGDKG